MKKQPGIHISSETVHDARHPTVGNGEVFKESVGALIDAGHAIAVEYGESEIAFEDSQKFKDWFDGLPQVVLVEDPPKKPL
ncbi:hypothetical protein [Massilia phyllosphaerae]|uniref:hypothetical protein n=1 Tax=Massilia phyllosphaerae TaxID=3106034 RepID=UPI002B1CC476|nr:hypothetical protein [Massilia sp. SGZ-792]